MTWPIQPLGKLPSAASATDKKILGPKIDELVLAANALNRRLEALESVPVPPEPPEPIPPDPAPPTGSAELPRIVPSYPYPTPTRIINAATSAELSAALNTARIGDENVEIRLTAARYDGHFFAASSGNGWITVKGGAVTSGTRVRPSTAIAFPKLVSTSTDPTLRVTGQRWRFEGIEVTVSPALSAITYNIVELEGADIVVAGCIVRGQPTSHIQRGVALNSGSTVVADCWLSDLHVKGFEGHGIGGWKGTGPFLIENNHIEAAGINLLIGGATPGVAGLRPSDITVRRNHLFKDPSWGPAGTGAGPWTEKNLLELKNAQRVLIEANVLENSWQDAQPTGSGIMLKSINDEGTCSWCQTTDVTIRNNYGRNIETPIVISSAENYKNPAAPPPPVSRVLISSNVFDDVGAVNGSGWAFQITSGHGLGAEDVVVERTVSAQGAGKLLKWGLLVDPYRGAQRAVFRDCVWAHGDYPVLNGEGGYGDAAMAIGAPNAVWSNMYFVKSPNHTSGTPVPTGTIVVTSEPALAAEIRAAVQSAISGVVVPP